MILANSSQPYLVHKRKRPSYNPWKPALQLKHRKIREGQTDKVPETSGDTVNSDVYSIIWKWGFELIAPTNGNDRVDTSS
uniref:Uncharacterized protein n=1 Tax=Caenorhabditis japonica TaxID=281687 RepID=A0A8R1EDK4_CAEJA